MIVNEEVDMSISDDDDGDDYGEVALKSSKPKKTPIEQLQLRKNELLKKVVQINILLDAMENHPEMMPALLAARLHYFVS